MMSNSLCKKTEQVLKNNNHQLLIDDGTIQSLSVSEREDFLYSYFSGFRKHKWQSDAFETILAAEYPNSFVKAVRLNQVFLQNDRIKFLLSIPLPFDLEIHKKIWKYLQNSEYSRWMKIEKELDQLSDYSLNLILISLVSWIENKRFAKDTKRNISDLSSIYGFFIHAYLSKYPNKTAVRSEDMLNFLPRVAVNNPLNQILNHIAEWLRFKGIAIDDYCFDLNINLTEHNEIIHQKNTAKSAYKWQVDEFRYNYNRIIYRLKAEQSVKLLLSKGLLNIPRKDSEEYYNINYELEVKKQTAIAFLSDLKLEKFRFHNGKTKKNEDIESFGLLIPLLARSTNYFHRYEKSVTKNYLKTNNWLLSYLSTGRELGRKGIGIKPFYLSSITEFIKQNEKALGHISWDMGDELSKLFSFGVRPRQFNRFGNIYDIWKKPFLRIGNHFFSPVGFLANNDWFYSFAQAGLENIGNKYNRELSTNSAKRMENDLAELFRKKGFDIEMPDDIPNHQMKGDVDIIVKDAQTTLFIQLKRTKFKLDQRARYNESVFVDKKGVQQLNDAEQYLSQENPIHTLRNKPIKWLVTTSFEVIGDVIDDCQKVNYFDILHALRSDKVKSISQLKSTIEKDEILEDAKNIFYNTPQDNPFNQLVREAGFPVNTPTTEQYYRPLMASNGSINGYHSIYRKALIYNEKGQKEKAIKLLLKCLKSNSFDVDVCGELGNIYTDLNDFQKAFLFYEKALEIIPLHPDVSYNYAVAMLSYRQYFKGLKLILRMRKTYPLVRDFQILYDDMFERFKAKLSKEQVSKLSD